jgi:hypothetical protein
MTDHKDQIEALKKEYKFASIYALILTPFAFLGVVQLLQMLVWLGRHFGILSN